ncbi:MAG: hypothetical protein DDT31_00220 [Syntrophomonadaceae bacterium]|nr:hypothetical protein [Bacillota bacterium]
MVIYAQVKDFEFRIGGFDITDNLTAFTLSRPQTSFDSPKTWSGSFELSPIVGQDENDLDDLVNPTRWARAQQVVTLSIARNPVFSGYVSTYRYDRNPLNKRGSGTLIDELGLQMLAKNPEIVIKEGVGTIAMWELVRDLLFAGANDADGAATFNRIFVDETSGIVGNINVPYTSSDPIKSAQDILGVNQIWAYCDQQGAIKLKKFDWAAGPTVSLDLDDTITFDRDLTIEDYSAEKVIVSGSKQISVPVARGVANEPDPSGNPDLGTEFDGGADGRPLRIVTTETKTLGEVTGNFNAFAVVNGGRETNFEITSTKTIEYTYSDDGDVIETLTTIEQPMGLVTATFEVGGKNGTYEPFNFIVPEIISETLTTRIQTRLRGALTGTFNADDTINGGFETITPINSIEVITNFTDQELQRVRDQQKNNIPNLKFTNSEGEEQNLYEKEELPKPDNIIQTLVFNGEAQVGLSYTPYFKVTDDREFSYIEDNGMAQSLAAFIARLEISRIKAYLVEIAIPDGYLINPSPFLKFTIGGSPYIIDGEQIELQDEKMSLIFTALPG